MNLQETLTRQGVELRQFDYDEEVLLVADFGPGVDSSVDVVDETAIVVIDEEQYEFPVPAGAQVFISNGVLTIEVNE